MGTSTDVVLFRMLAKDDHDSLEFTLPLPAETAAMHLRCSFTEEGLRVFHVGRGVTLLDATPLKHPINVDQCTWYVESELLIIELVKLRGDGGCTDCWRSRLAAKDGSFECYMSPDEVERALEKKAAARRLTRSGALPPDPWEKLEQPWLKTTLEVGSGGRGAGAWRGAYATMHCVGRANYKPVPVPFDRGKDDGFNSFAFEDSRQRGIPLRVQLGAGTLVEGLEAAVLGMVEGERAEVLVAPRAGYGKAGYWCGPCVDGSRTLLYDVELLRVEAAVRLEEIGEMSLETRMKAATERRESGNKLFAAKLPAYAHAEYEEARRLLEAGGAAEGGGGGAAAAEAVGLVDARVKVHLNLCACMLRLGREREAIAAADVVLGLSPSEPKAFYRTAQAQSAMGDFAQASRSFEQALSAATDTAMADDVRRQLARLRSRADAKQREEAAAAERVAYEEGIAKQRRRREADAEAGAAAAAPTEAEAEAWAGKQRGGRAEGEQAPSRASEAKGKGKASMKQMTQKPAPSAGAAPAPAPPPPPRRHVVSGWCVSACLAPLVSVAAASYITGGLSRLSS